VEKVSEQAWLCLRREGRSPSDRKPGGITNATSQAIIQFAEEQRVALMPLSSTIMANLNALTPPGWYCPAARAGHVPACGIAPCPVPFLATGSPLTPHPGKRYAGLAQLSFSAARPRPCSGLSTRPDLRCKNDFTIQPPPLTLLGSRDLVE
jgi:hypothetical protein